MGSLISTPLSWMRGHISTQRCNYYHKSISWGGQGVYFCALCLSESLPHGTNTIWYCYIVLLCTCHYNETGLITSDSTVFQWMGQKAHPVLCWLQSPWTFSAPSFQNDFTFHSTYLDFPHSLNPSSTLFQFLQYTQLSSFSDAYCTFQKLHAVYHSLLLSVLWLNSQYLPASLRAGSILDDRTMFLPIF